MLTKNEFNLMSYIENLDEVPYREEDVLSKTGLTKNEYKCIVKNLRGDGAIDESNRLTSVGYDLLKPYKVENAIILAAGMSTRFAPFSYEKPKGLTVVKGEVMIERQIMQLKAAGIQEIVLVLGHMLEKFLYLRKKFNLKIVVNNEYRYKNTHSSIFTARDYLKNSYICCADNYFPRNVFSPYEYRSVYSTLFMPGIQRGERGVTVDDSGLIISTNRPSKDQWVMNGFAYFDRRFSNKLRSYIEQCYGQPGTDALYWEQIYAEHIDELKLYERKFESEQILEFDSVSELEKFDKDYIKYNDIEMTRNICAILKCTIADISNIEPIKKGYTNKSFSFDYKGDKYIYRFPGKSTDLFIDRIIEKKAQSTANQLGIDETFIYEDQSGWKISKYVEIDETFDFSNPTHLGLLCEAFHKMQNANVKCGNKFDYFEKTKLILNEIKCIDIDSWEILYKNFERVKKISDEISSDDWPITLTHNDIYEDNLLISKNKLYVIDWEYAGDSDFGHDLCKLFVKNKATGDKIDYYLSFFYGNTLKLAEKKHIVGCAVVDYYYWYTWATLMVKRGKDYSGIMVDYLNVFEMYLMEYDKCKEEFEWRF